MVLLRASALREPFCPKLQENLAAAAGGGRSHGTARVPVPLPAGPQQGHKASSSPQSISCINTPPSPFTSCDSHTYPQINAEVIVKSPIFMVSFQYKASPNGGSREQGVAGERPKANESDKGSQHGCEGNFASRESGFQSQADGISRLGKTWKRGRKNRFLLK